MTEIEIDLDAVVKGLAEVSDRPAEEILKEIEGLQAEFGYNVAGAIATWKSDNKFLIAADRKEYLARVIAVETPRVATIDGIPTPVGNVHFVYNDPETGEPTFNVTTCWGQDRIDELYTLFELGNSYLFKARINNKGYLAWIRGAEPKEGAPEIDSIGAVAIGDLVNVIDRYEFVRGWIGRMISPKGIKLGFELDDLGMSPPLTVWFGGQYSKMTPDQVQDAMLMTNSGAHVAVYGYVSGTENEVKMSASSIWFL